jgi:hypothetical protein
MSNFGKHHGTKTKRKRRNILQEKFEITETYFIQMKERESQSSMGFPNGRLPQNYTILHNTYLYIESI